MESVAKNILLWLISLALVILTGCREVSSRDYSQLTKELEDFIADKTAEIGIAVIIDGVDTVAVNGTDEFPMMSVYKLPIALAVAEKCRTEGIELSESCLVTRDDLHRNTYSPMMQKYGDMDTVAVTLRELLEYALQQSDNNASDILLGWVNGADEVDGYMDRLGVNGMNIKWSEDEMHSDEMRCYDNYTTPIAMAELMSIVDRQVNDEWINEIKQMMERCATGRDRLSKPLVDSGAIMWHKTGSGDMLPDGRIMAVNDAGYVNLPNGRHYAIAVFVAGSAYDMDMTSEFIADISSMVLKALKH